MLYRQPHKWSLKISYKHFRFNKVCICCFACLFVIGEELMHTLVFLWVSSVLLYSNSELPKWKKKGIVLVNMTLKIRQEIWLNRILSLTKNLVIANDNLGARFMINHLNYYFIIEYKVFKSYSSKVITFL